MPLLTYSEKHSVGVKILDDQHAAFIGILNDLHAAMLKGQAQSVSGTLLPRLLNDAREHFSCEERLMESTGYPWLAEHRAEHRNLIAMAEQYVAQHQRGDNAIFLELLNLLRDWLSHHTQHIDKKYSAWLNEHGIR